MLDRISGLSSCVGSRFRSLMAVNTESCEHPPKHLNRTCTSSSVSEMDSDGFLSPLPCP